MGYSKQITLADGMFENMTAKAFPLVSGGKKNRKIVRWHFKKYGPISNHDGHGE